MDLLSHDLLSHSEICLLIVVYLKRLSFDDLFKLNDFAFIDQRVLVLQETTKGVLFFFDFHIFNFFVKS